MCHNKSRILHCNKFASSLYKKYLTETFNIALEGENISQVESPVISSKVCKSAIFTNSRCDIFTGPYADLFYSQLRTFTMVDANLLQYNELI